MVKLTYNWALAAICVVLFCLFSQANSAFASWDYILETVKMIVEIGIMALPLTLFVVMGGIDLSMSSSLVLSAVVGGILSTVYGPVVGLLATLATGFLCGAFNGVLIALLRLPPLVSTLATMYLFKGISIGITLGISAVGTNVAATPIATFLGSGTILGLPTQIWVFILLALLFHLVLSRTPYGRTLYSIGFNENATRFSGINTAKIKLLTYAGGGVVFAIAGLVFLGRFSTIQFDSADSYLMQVITAVVIGGCDMAGGKGTIKGTVLGVCIIGLLKGGMSVVLLPQTQQKIVIGLILLICLVAFDVIDRRGARYRVARAK